MSREYDRMISELTSLRDEARKNREEFWRISEQIDEIDEEAQQLRDTGWRVVNDILGKIEDEPYEDRPSPRELMDGLTPPEWSDSDEDDD
ncbi:hypothetical protein [Rhodomicrobium lacus]|uniref:hypothetical protein n=1 Tax=Rhodomicrobium lacus TaxID=2498452 RepID=UPI000F8EC495|nr:hypothetical protein [Rhodomicrobium lacus]